MLNYVQPRFIKIWLYSFTIIDSEYRRMLIEGQIRFAILVYVILILILIILWITSANSIFSPTPNDVVVIH